MESAASESRPWRRAALGVRGGDSENSRPASGESRREGGGEKKRKQLENEMESEEEHDDVATSRRAWTGVDRF